MSAPGPMLAAAIERNRARRSSADVKRERIIADAKCAQWYVTRATMTHWLAALPSACLATVQRIYSA